MKDKVVNKATGKKEVRHWCDFCKGIVPYGKKMVDLLVMVGSDFDGRYEFCSGKCRDRFYGEKFQSPLPLPDPYGNTGVLFNKKDES